MKGTRILMLLTAIAQTVIAQIPVQDQFKIDSIMAILETNSHELAKHYNELSYYYAGSDDKSALAYAKNALMDAEKNNNQLQIGIAYKYIGLACRNMNVPDSAMHYLLKAAGSLKNEDAPNELGDIYRYLSWVKENNDSTLVYAKRAVEYYKQCKNKEVLIIDLLVDLSNYYLQNFNNYEASLEYLNEAQQLVLKSGEFKDLHMIYFFKAQVYIKLNHFNRAYELFHKGKVEAKKNGIDLTIGNQINYATLLILMDSVEQGIDVYVYADSVLQNNPIDINFRPAVLVNTSAAYKRLGKYEQSIKYIDEAIEILKRDNRKHLLIQAYANKGSIFNEVKEYTSAVIYYDKALLMSKELGVDNRNKVLLEGATLAYIGAGNSSKATLNFKNYVFHLDSIRSVEMSKELVKMEAKYEAKFKEQRIENLESEKAQQELQLKNERKNRQLILIIAILITTLGSGSTLIYRIRQKQKRTQLAQTKAEIENRLLRVQMNPHFMFNSLNSVQSYIASNQNELAEDYLARFAQLTRAILNNSREDFILLSNEVETLQTYLELEQQRFNHAFNFSVEIDDEVDEDLLKVPPMLIQPYVENAIIHGVAPLKQNGEIKLSFKPNGKENSVLCMVEDNGIGREASAKINKGSKHKSLGLQVTKERFDLIKQQTGVEVKAEIIDLPDGNGTKVEMVIPVQ